MALRRRLGGMRGLRTVERLHVLGGLAGLGVAVGAAVDCLNVSLCPHMTPQLLQIFSQSPHSLFRHFSCPNGRASSLHRPRKKDSALTSPHAVGEAAGGHDRARCDGAPGDSRDSATGEHIGGKVESGVWYTGD
jgi:hypothetical protein